MLTAVYYGRNDNYSYGLTKRAALGLNMAAAQLQPGRDEIIFVDYNSNDDFPTFPEAIADTLTQRSRDLLRIIRVRPDFHHSYASTDSMPVLEAIARNIALRRSNPKSRWILSSNPDMLLLARGTTNLGTVIETLEDGYYGLPRFELPRFLWEQLDRTNPDAIANQIIEWRSQLALDEVVTHAIPAIRYDAPGDFQLFPRQAALDICGFDERMSYGWHIDSNMAIRLNKRLGDTRDLADQLIGYHCDHSRQQSSKHAAQRREDSIDSFVIGAVELRPASQTENWGADDQEFEEFGLNDAPSRIFASALPITDLAASCETPQILYGPESFDTTARDAAHTLPFVADCIVHCAPDSRLAVVSNDDELLRGIEKLLNVTGRPAAHYIALDDERQDEVVQEWMDGAGLFLLDAPGSGSGMDRSFRIILARIAKCEIARRKIGLPAREIVGLNVLHSRFEDEFLAMVETPLAPFSTRLRFGQIKQEMSGPQNLLGLVSICGAASRSEGSAQIGVAVEPEGHVFHGPNIRPLPGRYRAECTVTLPTRWPWSDEKVLVLEAVAGEHILTSTAHRQRSGQTTIALEFEYPPTRAEHEGAALEIRLFAPGGIAFSVDGLSLVRQP